MTKPYRSMLLVVVAVVFVVAACQSSALRLANADHHELWKGLSQVVAVMAPTAGNTAKGTVVFTQMGKKVKVEAMIEGLSPSGHHAIHIHQFGDTRKPNGTGTGGHYNPEMHDHALPDKSKRHAGDLGNLTSDASGKAKYTLVIENVSLFGPKNPIIGRGVIIHAKKDDGGQPTGNAGPRISQGVIGIANNKKKK